ncbi:SDR family NAD(P)-dependent oxidoreductase [Gracilimonas mengyeensis]|uniref:Short-chain dehydrogenase n=1 Tax=Gracilimonas mengyeensis TaxID=1302730 RepID=A0A521F9T6_9BACT|nr:SDR family NAD(P)-dependent oxidoreductase [Gracilimonas mengyeensis]SMO92972.1 Short-chain dehydrogenase [Gracilimonas mengyeensis]
MKKILITGATSGIGRELALQYAQQGHKVAMVGRRTERLEELKDQIGDQAFIHTLDVTDHEKAEQVYQQLIDEMGGLDVMILNAGMGRIQMLPPWESESKLIELNALAFAHGCHFAFDYFKKQGHGQIVGMSSMAALLAHHRAAAYTASKHFIANYMTSYRQKAKRVPADITVTEIRAGYIWTEMTERARGMFWVASTEKAAEQMIKGIEKGKNIFYVTKRWRILAWVAKLVPEWIWNRI